MTGRHVLIAGVSTRAAAESAARAGFEVTSLDAFADLDHHPSARALSLPRDFGCPFSPGGAVRAAGGIQCDAVAYLSSFENHRRAVARLAAGRALWGNAPDVLRRVRDPRLVSEAFARHGFVAPAVRVHQEPTSRDMPKPGDDVGGPSSRDDGADGAHAVAVGRWLVKPLASGGGHRVRSWSGSLPRRSYAQQWMPGAPYSVVFVAAGGRAATLGVSRQLAGDRAFGARGYRYCGSILLGGLDLAASPHARLLTRAVVLAGAAAKEFGLAGVNGVDFIADGSEPVPIEVNPRWSSSMELVERAHGLSVFGAHAASCCSGTLPTFDFADAARAAPAVGKAIVFARRTVVVGDTRPWLEDASVRDVPHPGERITAGQPVCTVFATGPSADDCYRALVERALRVYAELSAWALAMA